MGVELRISNDTAWDIAAGIVSGPIISALILLIPLGMITASVIVIDPSFVAYEFLPEEILAIPWIICSIIISFSNARAAYLIGTANAPSTTYYVKTPIFFVDVNKRGLSDEFPGRNFCEQIYKTIKTNFDDYIITLPLHEDYSWSFLISKNENCLIFISIYFLGNDVRNPHIEEFEISIQYQAPISPLLRLKFKPDQNLMRDVNSIFVQFLNNNNLKYSHE